MRLLVSFTLLLLISPLQDSAAQQPMVEEYRFGSFTEAEALSLDQFGNVYVVDGNRSTVLKFDLHGTLLAEVGGSGWDDTQFDRPTGIDAGLGIAVYVADYGNNRITRFDRGLHFTASLGGDDAAADPGFGYPLDVLNSSFEQLFVLDGENNRVLSLSGFNRVTQVFGGMESGEGRLSEPVALALDGSRHLYVLESGRVAAFDLFGNFLFHFGSDQFSDAQGISVHKGRVLVVTPDALHQYATDGEFLHTVTREQMVLAGECGEFRDATYTAPFLLLLTERSCILFPDN
jgi:DNA-binding beta-propeller fold protein YncE